MRRLILALVFAGVAALSYLLFFRTTPEQRIRKQLGSLADAVAIDAGERDPRARALRIRRAFLAILAPTVRVDIPDIVEDAHARNELAAMATSAAETFSSLTVAFDRGRVQVDGRSARADALATLVGTDHDGGRHRDEWLVEASLEETDGEWRIAAFTVRPPECPNP